MNSIKPKYIYKLWIPIYFLIPIYDIINFVDKIKVILKQWRSNNNFIKKKFFYNLIKFILNNSKT